MTILIGAFSMISCGGGSSTPAPSPNPPPVQGATRRLVAYYPSSAKSQAPPYSAQQIPYSKVTHIIHAFLQVNASADGGLVVGADLLEPALISKAHAAGVKVMISIGGGDPAQGAAFSAMAANSAARTAFVHNVHDFLTANGYDGVDIDWEVPTAPLDTANCTMLMQMLRQELPSPAYLISMAVTANPAGWGTGFDLPNLTPSVDFFNVMTYDFTGPWSTYAGHNSPLHQNPSDPGQVGSLQTSIDRYLNVYGVPAAKLNIGTAFYGYEFDDVTALWGFCTGGSCASATAQLYGTYIKPRINAQGWTANLDDTAKAPYLLRTGGAGFITYDDATSTALKVQYVLGTRQLGGVFMWDLNGDYDGSSQDLLDAMYNAYVPYRN